MKKKKKLILLSLLTIFTFFLLVSTYGIFESNIFRDVDIDIAKWEIEINGSKLSESQKTFSIDDIIWTSNGSVLEGKIAPGVEGYFDILIDPKRTDVAIRYDVTYDMTMIEELSFLTITKIEELGSNELVLTNENTYTGIIDLEDISSKQSHVIRTHIKWEDKEENNYKDYEIGTTIETFEIPISINVSQYLGEELEEYMNRGD
jgi:hypothetical protein